MKLLLTLSLLFSLKVMAHGDHSAPGAIPPSPNGGALSEAKHVHSGSHKHGHKEALEREIFFEAKLVKGTLSIFPLELDHKKGARFKSLEIKSFSELSFVVLDARKKKEIKSKVEKKTKAWNLKLEKTRARRFKVNIAAIFDGAKYSAVIQVEKK